MDSVKATHPRRLLRARSGITLFLFAVTAVFMVWVAFAIRDELAFGQPMRAAKRAVASRRFKDAEAPLNRWLRARPDDAEAHFLKARVALAKGDMKEVSEEMARARDLRFPRAQLERFDAIVKSQIGRYAEAEPVLVKIFTETTQPDPDVDEALARVYLQTYRLGQAATVLERWMHDSPQDAKPYLWFTELDSRTTTDSSSLQIAHYRAALERDPNLDKARIGLAELLRKGQHHLEAGPMYELYLKRNPNDPDGFVGAAQNALGLGDESAAVTYLDRALELAPDNVSALKEKAGIDRRHGNYAAALARLNRAAAVDPFDTETLYARSLTLARLGRADDAKRDQKRMTKIKEEQAWVLSLRDEILKQPDNVRLRYELAKWMFEHGRDEEGRRWAEHILAIQPNYRPAILLMADYHERKGEIGTANYYRFRASSSSPSATQ